MSRISAKLVLAGPCGLPVMDAWMRESRIWTVVVARGAEGRLAA